MKTIAIILLTATAFVARVYDGDTVTVILDDGTVETARIVGIDAPEMKPLEPGGPEARDFLAELVLGRYVGLEMDSAERDYFGRLLVYIYRDGVWINAEMIRSGHAEYYDKYRFDKEGELKEVSGEKN